MTHCVSSLVFVVALAFVVPASAAEDSVALANRFAGEALPFVKQHCLACHGEKVPKADLSLAVDRDAKSLVTRRAVWETVLEMVETGQMPPKEQPKPDPVEVDKFVTLVKALFENADRHAKPDPGRVTVRRLNRVEYNHTIRDLFGIDFNPAEDFPSDDIGYGFDNIGDVLTLSPVLMERYLAAAETISQRVIVATPPPPPRRHLSGRFLQPNNAQTSQGRFRPMNPADPEPVKSGPFAAPADYLKFSADADLILRANLYAETKGTSPVKVALFISGGKLNEASSDEEVDQLMGAALKSMKPLKILKIFEITARDANSVQQLEFPINRRGDIQRAGVALIKPPEGEEPPQLFIEHIWSEGPLETRSAAQLMLLKCTPDKPQGEQTREVITRLLSRAYRRPATPHEVEAMSKAVDQLVASGTKWETGIQWAVEATLCSPKFLFRWELDDRPDSPEPKPLDEFQLASRLSYFLWSSMPDQELFDLAGRGELTKSLDAQVRRMLNDPRSKSLVDNFAMQWLQLKRLKTVAPDPKRFPTFNEDLRQAMTKETELFFDAVMREDRSVLDLIDADFTFLNQTIARHYGISDTMGNWAGQKAERPDGKPIPREFVRVSLPHKLRGGLLTQASILTVTSNPTRTSPVKRGRWVLEQILGAPPPPPPPNVPELAEGEQAQLTGSLRQRMEQHRANPACANCHAKMDPIGFAFENYDAIGAFRTKDGDFPIETAGVLPDGKAVQGPAELKSILMEKRGQFTRCLTEKLMIYALGRGLEYYDRRPVMLIQDALAKNDYKFSALISEIVKSEPFRLRRGREE